MKIWDLAENCSNWAFWFFAVRTAHWAFERQGQIGFLASGRSNGPFRRSNGKATSGCMATGRSNASEHPSNGQEEIMGRSNGPFGRSNGLGLFSLFCHFNAFSPHVLHSHYTWLHRKHLRAFVGHAWGMMHIDSIYFHLITNVGRYANYVVIIGSKEGTTSSEPQPKE